MLESLFNKVNYKNTRTTTPIVAASVYRRLKQITVGVQPAPILPLSLKFALRILVDIYLQLMIYSMSLVMKSISNIWKIRD